MAIRNEKLGGTNWATETMVDPDINETFDAVIELILGQAQNAYQVLQANNVFNNKDNLAADEFVDSNGTNNTVNTGSTTGWYDTNDAHYEIGGATGTDTLNETTNQSYNTTNSSPSATGISILMSSTRILGQVTKSGTCTATRALITADGQQFTASFSGNVADFTSQNIKLKSGVTYSVSADSGGAASYTRHFRSPGSSQVKTHFTANPSAATSFNITDIETDSVLGTSKVISDTNTLTLDGTEKSICVYTDTIFNGDSTLTVKAGDGTLQTTSQTIDTSTKGSGVFDITSLGSGTLDLEFELTEGTSNETPELSGWGVRLIR